MVDVTVMLGRAAFALPETILGPDGAPINAAYGFLGTLLHAVQELKPKSIAAAFDSATGSFRHREIPGYKAGRVSLPASFDGQLALTRAMLTTLRVPIFEHEEYEADDVVATLVQSHCARGATVIVLSSDRDVLQLIQDPTVQAMVPQRRLNGYKFYDERAVENRYGVRPDKYVDFAALRGDPSDNLPGIPGIGEKTAALLLRLYGSVDSIYASELAEVPQRVRVAVKAHEDIVRRNIRYMRLARDVPVDTSVPGLDVGAWQNAGVAEWLEARGFSALLGRITKLAPARVATTRSREQHRARALDGAVLISCGARKRSEVTAAKELYSSPLFRAARTFAERCGQRWFIVSAKHGLLHPTDHVEPYDRSLEALAVSERARWAAGISSALADLEVGERITLLAGRKYTDALKAALEKNGRTVVVPLEGMSISQRVSWLTSHQRGSAEHLEMFYDLITEAAQSAAGRRPLASSSARVGWPQRGIYFFFDEDESRRDGVMPRIVRVGTHAVSRGSRSTLWGRLRTHRGGADGGGNHRSSVFRLHVGAALIERNQDSARYPLWGLASTLSADTRAAEHPLEREVSGVIGGLTVVCVAIDDAAGPASDRAYVERNAIGLLSTVGAAVDPPSPAWLGRASRHPSIRESGLWNVNHVGEGYDPQFLGVLARYVRVTNGDAPAPRGPLAPRGWARRARSPSQTTLF